ncbi:hypothetical protein DWQ65_08065 [Treponema phagedenis]|uniref:Uncharacterized protein n=1 Tax=Treponema phagedenis TaxID=162 RepID=A0AAE6IVJ6_TREPH|nr:hypothetical protein HMPREF9554_02194 [Treponema phagedenis F0421]QEJ94320.1 hypothetical protein FUT79_03265 [Treponema phagedenis]QEJ99008.1 hypothetical protein FUT82_14085 [Treponema phagedenis]QEK00279.1 hypothetical protein FUT84_03225 [Treponema phagedenis]QEK04516.1 hypothetical protein FUT83_12390 [Treponema phagedenis]
MAVVPNRSDVLKQGGLQSFKTHRFGFDKDVKTKPLCQTLFYKIVLIYIRRIQKMLHEKTCRMGIIDD